MLVFENIENLISKKNKLPDYGFIYIGNFEDIDSEYGLKQCKFYIPETEDEEIEIEDNSDYDSWLEIPSLIDIIDNYQKKYLNASTDNLIKAILYYWENDDFMN